VNVGEHRLDPGYQRFAVKQFAVIDQFENKLGPKIGAAAVVKAWSDPEFKETLMDDAAKALASLAADEVINQPRSSALFPDGAG
jgi:Nitrile hydratase, alpha chain